LTSDSEYFMKQSLKIITTIFVNSLEGVRILKKLRIRKVEELSTTAAFGMAIWAAHGLSSGKDWGAFVSGLKGNPHRPA